MDHPVTRLAEDGPAARLAAAPLEVRIVAYADKRAGQRLESMAGRFASWHRRYPSGPGDPLRPGGRGPSAGPTGHGWGDETAALVEARARALEAAVCTAAGVSPHEVRRLRWSARSIAEARA